MAGGRSSAPSCVGLRSIARRSRSCSASQARLFRPAAALSPPQARTKEASYPRFGNIVGGACRLLIGAGRDHDVGSLDAPVVCLDLEPSGTLLHSERDNRNATAHWRLDEAGVA